MPSLELAPETFDHFCAREHFQLDEILADVTELIRRASYIQAAKRFGEFRRVMGRHTIAEEKVLLPLVLEGARDPSEIAGRVRREHEELERLIDTISRAISQWDRGCFDEQVAQLAEAIAAHHRHEVAMLHPALDGRIETASDWRRLCGEAGLDCD